MKRKLQNTFLLLVMFLCFYVKGINVYAEENKEIDEYSYMNPIYKEMISETELDGEVFRGESTNKASRLAQTRNTYKKEVSTLIREIRSAMVNRDKAVELYFTQTGLIEDEWFDMLLEEAMKDTGVTKEGDYLRYNLTDCQISYEYYTQDADKPSSTTQNYFDIVIKFTYLTTTEQEEELEDLVTKVLQEIGVFDLSYNKRAEAIYDYICDNVEYDYENLENDSELLKYSAYGALKNKKAVCQGYASLFYYLANRSGLKTKIISGTSYDIPHAWNIVKLENSFYNVDATWDAGVKPRAYFLKGSTDFNKDHIAAEEYQTEEFLQNYPVSQTDYTGPSAVASGTCGENLSWFLDGENVLRISGTGEMTDWEKPREVPWAEYSNQIVGVVFEGEITSIGKNAFYGCSEISMKLMLPENLIRIGESAFYSCLDLNGVLTYP